MLNICRDEGWRQYKYIGVVPEPVALLLYTWVLTVSVAGQQAARCEVLQQDFLSASQLSIVTNHIIQSSFQAAPKYHNSSKLRS